MGRNKWNLKWQCSLVGDFGTWKCGKCKNKSCDGQTISFPNHPLNFYMKRTMEAGPKVERNSNCPTHSYNYQIVETYWSWIQRWTKLNQAKQNKTKKKNRGNWCPVPSQIKCWPVKKVEVVLQDFSKGHHWAQSKWISDPGPQILALLDPHPNH